MKIRLLSFIAIVSFYQVTVAQKKLPVIKSNIPKIDIREDNILKKDSWTIVPEAKPDIYMTSAKKVTFYTDVDSISFNIDPKTGVYDFIVLLNEKDTAYTQIKYQVPPLEKLKKGDKYNFADTRYIPKFSYQDKNDPNLVKIRTDFKLDSIAGEGNEISRILNLLHWVHDIVRHDGSSDNPTLKNAIELVKICKAGNRGVNCRMLATILNECYLSMGIKSRYVTCMPRETNFDDCHVINMVYSNDLQKWIWIDPTFDAYLMDEKGELLGLQDARERLINGKTIILSPEANWNRKTTQLKTDYIDTYMAKNLYRLECPLVSEYDTETWKNGKEIVYVELLPLNGIEQTPQMKKQLNNKTGVRFTYYKTNNPDLFWAKPE